MVLLLNVTWRNPVQISGGIPAILTEGWRETGIISRLNHSDFLMFVSSSSYQDAVCDPDSIVKYTTNKRKYEFFVVKEVLLLE
jgi:hypothetical protein